MNEDLRAILTIFGLSTAISTIGVVYIVMTWSVR